MTQYINYYEHCGSVWSMIWDCMCDDRCPDCRTEIAPYKSIEVDEGKPEKCFFCGDLDTISFNEHYTFCKNCSAIYTECIVVEKSCGHIKENVIVAEREPWFAKMRTEARETKAYVIPNSGRCSICNSITIADGW